MRSHCAFGNLQFHLATLLSCCWGLVMRRRKWRQYAFFAFPVGKDLRWLMMACVRIGLDQICTLVNARFSRPVSHTMYNWTQAYIKHWILAHAAALKWLLLARLTRTCEYDYERLIIHIHSDCSVVFWGILPQFEGRFKHFLLVIILIHTSRSLLQKQHQQFFSRQL